MTREPRITKDGFAALPGGVDSSRAPILLGQDRAAFAVNVSFRGGFPRTRPPFSQLGLRYPTTEIAQWIETHAVQGAAVFTLSDRPALIVSSIGGRIFTVDPSDDYKVREITPVLIDSVAENFVMPAIGASVDVIAVDAGRIPVGLPAQISDGTVRVDSKSGDTLTITNVSATPGFVSYSTPIVYLDPNTTRAGRAWIIQAEIFCIIQDGHGRAIIFDGANVFRSDPKLQQIPTGTVMAYGIGRLWVAVNKTEFVAGDIVGGPLPSGEPSAYHGLDNILYFTENSFLAEGGAFSVPIQSGEITAMQFMPVIDTSTGNGPLIIFTELAAFSVNAPADRDTWKDVRSPIQTVVLTGNGAASQYSTVATTNSDLFFRSADGIRSFVLAIREFQGSWGNTPISTEMARVLDNDDETLLKWGSAIQFDNRLLFTCLPVPLQRNAYHQGIGVLDFHPISGMREKLPPAYNGVWTGIRPVLMFKGQVMGEEHAYCWNLNADGRNELWELQKKGYFDNEDGRIISLLETRAMWGRDPMGLKRLESGELFVDEVKGQVDFNLSYFPDSFPCEQRWGIDRTVCATWRECGDSTIECQLFPSYQPGYKTRLSFGQPPDGDEDVDAKPIRNGYDFTVRIAWEGHCRLRRFVARFLELEDEVSPPTADPVLRTPVNNIGPGRSLIPPAPAVPDIITVVGGEGGEILGGEGGEGVE